MPLDAGTVDAGCCDSTHPGTVDCAWLLIASNPRLAGCVPSLSLSITLLRTLLSTLDRSRWRESSNSSSTAPKGPGLAASPHSHTNQTTLVPDYLTQVATTDGMLTDWSWIICCHSCAACVKRCDTLATSDNCPATIAACKSLCRSSIHSCISLSQ